MGSLSDGSLNFADEILDSVGIVDKILTVKVYNC